jgi:magnesium-transporting ATPase (P-type)
MKERWHRFFRYLFRIDVFNRIIVFSSMVLFMVFPSYILYWINDYNNSMETVLPCLLLLGVLVGTGLMTLYRPGKVSWFYFLETLFILALFADEFIDVKAVDCTQFNTLGIFWAEAVYCIIGFLINLFYFIHYLRKLHKNRNAFNENTNADTFYDFLNGAEINGDIEGHLEEITKQGNRNMMKAAKGVKLSRFTRWVSLVITLVSAVYYFIILGGKGILFESEMYYPLIAVSVTSPVLMVASVMFPKDFKYMYFYNSGLFMVASLLASGPSGVSPFFCILSIAVLCLSLLLTLITEGRTWTGAKPD